MLDSLQFLKLSPGYGLPVVLEALRLYQGAFGERKARLVDRLILDPWPGQIPLEEGDVAFLHLVLRQAPVYPLAEDNLVRNLLLCGLNPLRHQTSATDTLDCREAEISPYFITLEGPVSSLALDMVLLPELVIFAEANFPAFTFAHEGRKPLAADDQIQIGFGLPRIAQLIQALELHLQAIRGMPRFCLEP